MGRPIIIIMDEDPGVASTLSDLLKLKGYDTMLAGRAPQQKAPHEIRPRIVLLDLKQPDKAGREALDRARSEYAGAETIILTGCSTLDLAIEATTSWAYSYILKPYVVDQLYLHIGHALEKQELADKVRYYQHLGEGLKGELAAIKPAPSAHAVSEFIENIRCEARTSLAIITGFSTLLLEEMNGRLNEKQREYVGHIIDSGKSLQQAILSSQDLPEAEQARTQVRL